MLTEISQEASKIQSATIVILAACNNIDHKFNNIEDLPPLSHRFYFYQLKNETSNISLPKFLSIIYIEAGTAEYNKKQLKRTQIHKSKGKRKLSYKFSMQSFLTTTYSPSPACNVFSLTCWRVIIYYDHISFHSSKNIYFWVFLW